MREEIENLRRACLSLRRERRLSELSRMAGSPPYRTIQDFAAGADPSGRTLLGIEIALALLPALEDEGKRT